METLQVVEIVSRIITAPETMIDARYDPKYFTRNRAMSFVQLLYFLLNPAKECLQIRLNRFYRTLREHGISIPQLPISQQALSKARSHFDHSPFEKMTRSLVEEEYSGRHPLERWNGYLVAAVDGSSAVLPHAPQLKVEFGVSGCESARATAGISVLYDVLNNWILDASIGSYPMNERSLAKEHVRVLRESAIPFGDLLLLFDRGYPSEDFLTHLQQQGVKYLMRCQKSWLSQVEAAPQGDSVCTLKNGVKIRVYKFLLPSGQEERLVTNLYDTPSQEFPSLYFLRWGVEGGYDVVKNKVALEDFSGCTKNAIFQDFWATITLTNIAANAHGEADELVQAKCAEKNNTRSQAPNVSQLVGSLKDTFIFICLLTPIQQRSAAINVLIREIARSIVLIRPDRPPRKRSKAPKKKQYPMNRKSNI